MSSKEWKKYKLGELREITSSKRIYYSEYISEGVPFFRSKEIIERYNGHKITTKLFLSPKRYVEIKNKFGVPGRNDLLLTSVGTLGIPFLIETDEKFYFKDGNLTWFRNNGSSLLLSKYLFYWFISPSGKHQLEIRKIGTTQQALTIEALKKAEIDLPPLATQHHIVEVLSSMDDKIELNRQANATLEAIAQAIFKEWFVDFNFPGATGELSESELGLIPKGWNVVPIGELFDYVIGGDWGSDERQNEDDVLCSIIRGTDFENVSKGIVEAVPHRYIKQNSFHKRMLREGDIILEISGGSKDQATGRNLWVSDELLALFDSPVIATSFCRLIRPVNIVLSVYSGVFLSGFYRAGGTWDYQLQSTGISNFQFTDFSTRHKIVLPDTQTLRSFHQIISGLIAFSGSNSINNQILTSTLNLLLPRLVGGSKNCLESKLY